MYTRRFSGKSMFLSAQLERFRMEIATNPRLKRMTWLILLIVLIYSFLGLHDINRKLRTDHQRLVAEVVRLQQMQDPSVWQARLYQEKELSVELGDLCLQALSEQLASADVQTKLQRITSKNEMENSRLTLSKPEVHSLDSGNVWYIRANISARVNIGNVPLVIRELETLESRFVVEQVRYVDASNGGKLDVTVGVCIKEGEA